MNYHKEIKGTLIPMGGSEDKGDLKNNKFPFKEKGVLSHVLREAGGAKARVVVIPTASKIPIEVGDNYLRAFDILGCEHVDILNIQERRQSESRSTISLIEQADCIMFSGGNQTRIYNKFARTKFQTLLLDRYHNEEIVIAGTSAGAMAMVSEMIAGGSSTESLQKGAVKMRKGLGLLPGFIIDTHFVRRGRFGRLAEAVATFPDLLGLGLAEDTGLVIKNGDHFRVIGSGMVIVLDASNLSHNTHEELKTGTPMSMANLTTHILANGDRFSLNDRKIEVLPIKEAFV